MKIITMLALGYLIVLCFPEKALSFSWRDCKRSSYFRTDRGGVSTRLFNGLMNQVTSTGQFFTSTGGCAMIGKVEHDKRVFFANNFDKLREDFSRGSGEYSLAYAKMHGCNQEGQKYFPRLMKKHYFSIKGFNDEPNEEIFKNLEDYFNQDNYLKMSCS